MKSDIEMFAILNLIDIDVNNNQPYFCKVCGRKHKTETACYRHIDNKHDQNIKNQMSKEAQSQS